MEVLIKLLEHDLIPKHEILTPEGAEAVLKKYGVTRELMPQIKEKDPAIEEMKAKPGDIIKITRNNPVTGKSYYYRVVIEG
ncbi:MAG TPA: DNA-directed RNA polymerase subunit H [Candidatus Altiarchaeales archaeon]|mgnify:CR=1 FL=1|nr:DNA-directed RNA polymerase subunit H [Candidatus Altiarchaeales archaeon]